MRMLLRRERHGAEGEADAVRSTNKKCYGFTELLASNIPLPLRPDITVTHTAHKEVLTLTALQLKSRASLNWI